MKKFLISVAPYMMAGFLFFVAVGGGDGLVPASGETWLLPWTWSLDETRELIVAGLNALAAISAAAFVALGVLVASTPVVEAKATEWGESRSARDEVRKNPPQRAPSQAAVEERANAKV